MVWGVGWLVVWGGGGLVVWGVGGVVVWADWADVAMAMAAKMRSCFINGSVE